MLSETLRERLLPASLLSQASESTLTAFLREYGDTQFLLISLAEDSGELMQGLVTMTATAGTAVVPTGVGGGLETQVGDVDAHRAFDTSIPPPHVFDEEALTALLGEAAHFAVPLRKRGAAGTDLERVRVGRSPTTDVVLQQSGISKLHAWLEMDEHGVFYLSDAGSKNGTRVNDDRLDENEMVRVRPGDRLEFAAVDATLCLPETLWRALK